jgi:hypothetical protein
MAIVRRGVPSGRENGGERVPGGSHEDLVLRLEVERDNARRELERARELGRPTDAVEERLRTAQRALFEAEAARDADDAALRDHERYVDSLRAQEELHDDRRDLTPGEAQSLDDKVDQAEDELTRRRVSRRLGCSMPLIAALITVGVVSIAAGIMLNDDDDTPSGTSATDPTSTVASSAEPAGGGAVALSSFAGHYVLVSGLDDPTGVDVYYAQGPGPYEIEALPGSAELDIGPDGAITGGRYHASIAVESPNSNCTRFTNDASRATGSIAVSGEGAIGLVEWPGVITRDCEGSRPTDDGLLRHGIGILGDTLILCRFPELESPTTCGASYSRVVATFRRA